MLLPGRGVLGNGCSPLYWKESSHFLFPILWLQHQGSLHVWHFPLIQLVCTDTVLDGLLVAANCGITSVITFVMELVFCVVILCSWKLIALRKEITTTTKKPSLPVTAQSQLMSCFCFCFLNLYQAHVQPCLILWDPLDYSLSGSSTYGIFQARILEWVTMSSSRGCPQSREKTHVSCIADRLFLSAEPSGKTVQFSSATQSCPTLQPHELLHARLPCPPPTPGVYPNLCTSSQWYRSTITSSVIIPFASCLRSFPASGSFAMSQFSLYT